MSNFIKPMVTIELAEYEELKGISRNNANDLKLKEAILMLVKEHSVSRLEKPKSINDVIKMLDEIGVVVDSEGVFLK